MTQPAPSKKDIVLGKTRKRPKPMFIGLSIILLLIGAAGATLVIVSRARTMPQSNFAETGAINESPGAVSYPLSIFEDGRARHFEHHVEGVTIRYFILKSADGVVRAAFDACDVCWPAGKGYAQDGDDMVCRNCGRRFSSVNINEVQGGCNPAPLQRLVRQDQLVIRTTDILQGRKYFNLNKKA